MKKPKPPKSIEEVKAYIKEKRWNVDPQAFWDKYEAQEWYDKYGDPVLSWKGRVVTWHYKNPKTIAALNAKKISDAQVRQRKARDREQCEAWLNNKTTPALLDLKKDKSAIIPHWLIDKILAERKRNEQRRSDKKVKRC